MMFALKVLFNFAVQPKKALRQMPSYCKRVKMTYRGREAARRRIPDKLF